MACRTHTAASKRNGEFSQRDDGAPSVAWVRDTHRAKRVSTRAAHRHFQSRIETKPLELVADLVECTSSAGICDPLAIVSESVCPTLASAEAMFPCLPKGLEKFSCLYAGERDEYVKHTIILLRCGKVRLRHEVLG